MPNVFRWWDGAQWRSDGLNSYRSFLQGWELLTQDGPGMTYNWEMNSSWDIDAGNPFKWYGYNGATSPVPGWNGAQIMVDRSITAADPTKEPVPEGYHGGPNQLEFIDPLASGDRYLGIACSLTDAQAGMPAGDYAMQASVYCGSPIPADGYGDISIGVGYNDWKGSSDHITGVSVPAAGGWNFWHVMTTPYVTHGADHFGGRYGGNIYVSAWSYETFNAMHLEIDWVRLIDRSGNPVVYIDLGTRPRVWNGGAWI